MPNRWSKKAYVQGFDCESTLFKKSVNMFEQTDMAEYIYEGVVEPSYKNSLGQTLTIMVAAGKREEKNPHHRLTPRWARALAGEENE